MHARYTTAKCAAWFGLLLLAVLMNAAAQASTLRIIFSGNGGGSAQVEPSIGTATSGTTSFTVADGTVVTVVTRPDSLSKVLGYSGACSGTATLCQLTMSGDKDVTVTLDHIDTFRLSTFTQGAGTGAINRSPSTDSYTQGTEVTLTAAPEAGSTFGAWSGGCSGTSPTCKLTISATTQSVTARFDLISSIAIRTAGTGGGHVVQSPNGTTFFDGTSVAVSTFANGTRLTLAAVSNPDSEFAGWSGGCSGVTLTCVLNTSTPVGSVTATFNRLNSYTVTTTTTGSGSVTRDNYLEKYDRGLLVVLTAQPESGQAFRGWTGGPCDASKDTTCQFTIFQAQSIAADFSAPVQVGNVFSTRDRTTLSFVRFYNADTVAGTATVTIYDASNGAQVGQWTSPSIPVNADVQVAVSDLEAAVTVATKPAQYSLVVVATFKGAFRHVLWSPTQRTFTNVSTCSGKPRVEADALPSVHSSALTDYPSLVTLHNTGAAPTPVTLGIYNGDDGVKLGTYITPAVPAHGALVVSIAEVEKTLSKTAGVSHYNIKLESTFTGFTQHLVNNLASGILTDISAACAL